MLYSSAATALLLLICFLGVEAQAQTPHPIAQAVQAAEEVDAMRRRLAPQTLRQKEVSETTFGQVCKPVGARAEQIAQEKGWQFLQMAEKFRNPSHKADKGATRAIERFKSEPSLQGFWIRTEAPEEPGIRYFRRITVEKACLACHGEKENRPEFIRKKYPEDQALGFKEGDLRGIYSILIPEK